MGGYNRKGALPIDPYLVQGLLKRRKAAEDELAAMAANPAIVAAVVKSRDGARRGEHFRAAHQTIRALESIDQLLYGAGGIKNLPKPVYPGGLRI